jgi:hypothetical protein
LVPYADGLEHCIHPTFIRDQLTRSLARLRLATVDVYLLHNPEYFLGWASRQGIDAETARAEYDRRLLAAFRCLDEEAQRGRIRYYGVSSNTLPVPSERDEFTCLERILALAETVGAENRLAVVQFPLNLVESGAVLTTNQPSGATLLAAVREAGLGALVNRPLNAIGPAGLVRLADVERPRPPAVEATDEALQIVAASEAALAGEVFPGLAIPEDLRTRIQTQVGIAAALREHYRGFPSYDAWCQIRDTHLLPRVSGVLAFCERQPAGGPLRQWGQSHRRMVADALDAVTALYAGPAAERAEAIKRLVGAADPDWRAAGSLSQLAIRALRTTTGVSAVLVGMRRRPYVKDVLQELAHFKAARPHAHAWERIREPLDSLLGA